MVNNMANLGFNAASKLVATTGMKAVAKNNDDISKKQEIENGDQPSFSRRYSKIIWDSRWY